MSDIYLCIDLTHVSSFPEAVFPIGPSG